MSDYVYKPPFVTDPYLWENTGYKYILTADGKKMLLGEWGYSAGNTPFLIYAGGELEYSNGHYIISSSLGNEYVAGIWQSSTGSSNWFYNTTYPQIPSFSQTNPDSYYCKINDNAYVRYSTFTPRYGTFTFCDMALNGICKSNGISYWHSTSSGSYGTWCSQNELGSNETFRCAFLSCLAYNSTTEEFRVFYMTYPTPYGERESNYFSTHGHHSWELEAFDKYSSAFNDEFLAGDTVKSTVDYNDTPTATAGGGWGTQEVYSESIDFPSLPSASVTNSGFIRMYKCTPTQLSNLSSYLWSDDFITNFSKLIENPIDSIISLSLIPLSSSITTEGRSFIKVGNITTTAEGERLPSQWLTIDFGTLVIPYFWATALDYNPNTQIQLFLPYISAVNLDVDDVMGAQIHLKYNIDLLSGQCVALLKVTRQYLDSVLYHWTGNVETSVPLTAQDKSQRLSAEMGLLTSGLGTIAGIASGGATAPMAVAGVLATAGNVTNTLMTKNHIVKSSSCGSTSGFIGVQTPYLIITRAVRSQPANIRHLKGLPCNITATLGNLNGFTIVDKINIENIVATEKEISEIENLLKSGVIL